jgi:tetraacyldisaccharide 4'-kinase
MRAPSFWWREPGLEAALLAPFAAAYGAVAAQRLRLRGQRADIPIVCIGDPTLGGGGKTPTALATAKVLAALGQRPVFLTRGYGGRTAGPVRVDLAAHRAEDVGDEPLLLARAYPTIVARVRAAGAAAARAAGASVVVMDDGFQNPSLVKDAAILVVDGRRGIGNGRVCPAGPLRAPFDAQLAHAHAVLVVGNAGRASEVVSAAAAGAIPIFHGRLLPQREAVAALAGKRVLAFAGIADPDKFFRTLEDAGIEAPVRHGFPDHHRYTAAEASRLIAEADRQGFIPVTTEKDLVRLDGEAALAALRARVASLPVTLVLDEEERFGAFLRDRIMSSA